MTTFFFLAHFAYLRLYYALYPKNAVKKESADAKIELICKNLTKAFNLKQSQSTISESTTENGNQQ